jgi:hypothetical protein
MKAEVYNALASLNRSFEIILESLKTLHENGVISKQFVQDQTIVTQELCAALNFMIVQRLTSRETEDVDHFGKMRSAIETRIKSS